MTTLRRILTIALIGALASVGLVVSSAGAATTKTYHQSDSGDTVKVSKGNAIKIDLLANSGTGCGWAITQGKKSSRIKIVSRKTRDAAHDPGTTGYPFHTVYKVRAAKAGKVTLKIALKCPGGTVGKRFKLTIKVV